jgi:hypothetical protein
VCSSDLIAILEIINVSGIAILDIINVTGIAILGIIEMSGDCYPGDYKCVAILLF